jgi:RNA polymerase sigma-70 factor (ECF subfamily)
VADDLQDLVRRCLAGQQEALADLVRQFQGQVFGLCQRMLGNRHDAEDAAQVVFVRALRNLHRWDPNRDFRPWLLAIAGNYCRTMLLARSRRLPTVVVPEDALPDDGPPSEVLRELQEEFQLALRQLRDEYRLAFVLFHEQQLSYAEIAQVLGCPLGTIKTWVHRARRELALLLKDRGVIEELPHELRGI